MSRPHTCDVGATAEFETVIMAMNPIASAGEETNNSDDGSMEGAIARNLFRTDDDTDDSSSCDEQDGECRDPQSELLKLTNQQIMDDERANTFVQYPIMDIVLEEQTIGGSIAQRLWPAAAYLANFVMMQHPSPPLSSDSAVAAASCMPTTIATLHPVPTTIIELGAGVGLTGLQLATHFNCRVLLTDLPDAMPLLLRNIELNRRRFRGGEMAVHAQVLFWGNQDDADAALQWIGPGPFLIIASDCVYFPKLHEPLEQTLCHLLRGDHSGSKCWMAGMRRWKSDNSFYKNIGKKTKTATHHLACECHQETVTRTEDNRREIIRVFSIEWKEQKSKKRIPHVFKDPSPCS